MAVGEKAPPYWEDFSCMGRFYLWCAVLLPYAIQFFVLGALGKEIPQLWEEFDVPILQDLWWNTTAFSVLFVYMFKDLVSFYSSVWYYITWQQKRQGGLFTVLTRLGAATVEAAAAAKDLALTADNSAAVRDAKKRNLEARHEAESNATFLLFKIWLSLVMFLYFGMAVYSLISIPMAESLKDKLEVSLSVFVVLEVDDWAYDLFIGQENILDDEEFNVRVFIKKDRDEFVRKQEKVKCFNSFLLSVFFIMMDPHIIGTCFCLIQSLRNTLLMVVISIAGSQGFFFLVEKLGAI